MLINWLFKLYSAMFLGDETYAKLERSFLSTGKGRPPDPPEVLLTNRLLLQLVLLKNEGNKTWNNVSS